MPHSFVAKILMQKSIQERMFAGIGCWRQSGLTQKTWCEQQGVSYATFHYWYKRYRKEEQGRTGVQGDEGGFVQLTVDSSQAIAAWCELCLPDGRKLVFHQAVSAEFVRSLIG
jgi:hypothetical protein